MSWATLLGDVDTGGLWPMACGVGRNVDANETLLVNCGLPRRNDIDGKANLAEETLADVACFVPDTCPEQVRIREELIRPEKERTRTRLRVDEEFVFRSLHEK